MTDQASRIRISATFLGLRLLNPGDKEIWKPIERIRQRRLQISLNALEAEVKRFNRTGREVNSCEVVKAKIYVDNLAAATTETDLRDLFSPYGGVLDANIWMEHENCRPLGFGFVTMVTPESARAAVQALNGKVIRSNTLIVSPAWPHEGCEHPLKETMQARQVLQLGL